MFLALLPLVHDGRVAAVASAACGVDNLLPLQSGPAQF